MKSEEILETPWYFSYFQMRKARLRKKCGFTKAVRWIRRARFSFLHTLSDVRAWRQKQKSLSSATFEFFVFDACLVGLREPPGTGVPGH